MTVLFLLCLAHVCADFVLQTEGWVRGRGEGKLRYYLLHGLWVALTLFLALQFYGLWTAAILASLISCLHLLVDALKDRLSRGRKPAARLLMFIMDQLLHLCLLAAVWQCVDLHEAPGVTAFYRSLLTPRALAAFASLSPARAVFPLDKLLCTAIAYVVAMFGGASLIRAFLDALKVAPREDAVQQSPSQFQVGKYIGVLERGLLLTFVLIDALSAVGFVIAAKSLARYKELDNRGFAEYYLVGTLASALWALAAGLGARALLTAL